MRGTWPHPHQHWANPCHICTGTGLAATSSGWCSGQSRCATCRPAAAPAMAAARRSRSQSYHAICNLHRSATKHATPYNVCTACVVRADATDRGRNGHSCAHRTRQCEHCSDSALLSVAAWRTLRVAHFAVHVVRCTLHVALRLGTPQTQSIRDNGSLPFPSLALPCFERQMRFGPSPRRLAHACAVASACVRPACVCPARGHSTNSRIGQTRIGLGR